MKNKYRQKSSLWKRDFGEKVLSLKESEKKRKFLMLIAGGILIIIVILIIGFMIKNIKQKKENSGVTGNAVNPEFLLPDGTQGLMEECSASLRCKPCLVCWLGSGSIGIFGGPRDKGFGSRINSNPDYSKGTCFLKFSGERCVQGGQEGRCNIKSATDYKCVTKCTPNGNDCPTSLSGRFCGKVNKNGQVFDVVLNRNYEFYCNPSNNKCCIKNLQQSLFKECARGEICYSQVAYPNQKCMNPNRNRDMDASKSPDAFCKAPFY